MIVDKITIKINKSNMKHFNEKGYNVVLNDIIEPKINDINKGSHSKILCECDNCGSRKTMEFRIYFKNTKKLTENYYCKKCSYIKNIETNQKKYGTNHPMQNKLIVDKLLATNNERYGENSASKLLEFKQKQQQTNIDRYGVVSPLQNKEVRNKQLITMIDRYGVEYPLQNEIIKLNYKKSNIDKYGVDNISKLDNIKEKKKKTCIDKYGVDNPMKNNDIKKRVNITKAKLLKDKYPTIINIDYNNKIIIMKCDNGKKHNFKIPISVFQNRKALGTIICTKCNNGTTSGEEIHFSNFIKENYNGKVVKNDRKVLNGKELDIYLPELGLAFEFNGLYWHNELNKSNDYHYMKTNICEEKNIHLIHIWEDDWVNKKEIVKSMILNKLHKIQYRIYARKCIVKEVTDNKVIRTFLDNNHLQGFVGSKVKIGLYYEGNLVSLMTFGKLRKIMNSNTYNNSYELLRFCNKLNTSVIGGAGKLFKYFTRNFIYNDILSYADRSHSNGNLYKQLGFTLEHITQPNYYYIIKNIRKYRFGFRKDILVKQGYDKNMTEHEIMLSRKIYRIYNSGNFKFSYKLKKD